MVDRLGSNSPETGPRVLLVAIRKVLDQPSTGLIDALGHHDPKLDEEVPLWLASRRGNALALEPQLLSRRAAGRDRQRLHAVERGNVDLRAEDGLGQRDRHLDQQVAPFALEVRMRLDGDMDGQVPALGSLGPGLSLALEPELGAGVHAGGILTTRFSALPSPR